MGAVLECGLLFLVFPSAVGRFVAFLGKKHYMAQAWHRACPRFRTSSFFVLILYSFFILFCVYLVCQAQVFCEIGASSAQAPRKCCASEPLRLWQTAHNAPDEDETKTRKMRKWLKPQPHKLAQARHRACPVEQKTQREFRTAPI